MHDNYLKFIGSIDAATGSIRGYSEEQTKFVDSCYKCLKCNKTLLNGQGGFIFNFYSTDGAKLTYLDFVRRGGMFNHNLVQECPNCGYRWNLYANSNPIRPNKLEVVSIIETHRSEEMFGTEKKLIDNSKSTSKTTLKITVSREWSKSYSIQDENIQVNGTELNIGIKLPELELPSIKASSQETLKKKYFISEEKRETYTEEVQFEVPEHKKLTVIFSWKRILQHGIIKFLNQDNREFDVPFTVGVGVTFDQSQDDE